MTKVRLRLVEEMSRLTPVIRLSATASLLSNSTLLNSDTPGPPLPPIGFPVSTRANENTQVHAGIQALAQALANW